MTRLLSQLFLLVFACSASLATKPPGYDRLETVIPKATSAFVGEIESCEKATEPGNHVIRFAVVPVERLWGTRFTEKVNVSYKEFMPSGLSGMSIGYANYTGSGIESNARPGEKYICLIGEANKEALLLRLEPLENREKVLEFYAQHKTTKPLP